jgi:hypothetical protein
MKHLNKLFVALIMLAVYSSQAQDSNNPWAISFGANAVDTRVSAASKFEDQFSQLFNAKDNWNILPSVSFVNSVFGSAGVSCILLSCKFTA